MEWLDRLTAVKATQAAKYRLKDFTSNPETAQELRRTASLKPLLEKALRAKAGLNLVPVENAAQAAAQAGAGYLWNHSDEAAKLGAANQAQYVVLGRVSKPSFLFVHYMIRLVDVKTQQLIAEDVVEIKGQQNLVSAKGIDKLADNIYRWLSKRA